MSLPSLLAAALLLFPTAADLQTTVAPTPGLHRAAPLALGAETAATIAAGVDGMTPSAQLELFLGRRSQPGRALGKQSLDSDATRLRKLRRDPALRSNFGAIESAWIAAVPAARELFADRRELVQVKVMVARNLYFQKQAPTRDNVEREARHIVRERQRVAQIELFEGRSVIYAASADKLRRTRRNIFGQRVTQNRMERSGAQLTFIRSDTGREQSHLRRDLAAALEGAEGAPVTFVFEGHGRATALKFAGSLRAQQLAEMIAAHTAADRPAIVITSACEAHTLMREVLRHLDRLAPDGLRPIFVVPGEYGQQLVRPVYGDPFLHTELGLGSGGSDLGGLMQRAAVSTSVYVPDENNVPTQVL